MPRLLELEGSGGVEGNVTFWINGITIAKGWMIACGLRELVLDKDLSENHVKVTIYGTTKSQIMSIGYITIDSNNFLWTLSLVIVCILWLTSHVGRWQGKRNWCKEKNNTRLLRKCIKIQMWIVLFQRLKNFCMMNQM